MAVSYFALLPLALVVLLLLAGLAVVVALLASPKTRAVGVVLILLGLVVLGLGAAFLTLVAFRATSVQMGTGRGSIQMHVEETSGSEYRIAPQPIPPDGGARSSTHPTMTPQPTITTDHPAPPKSKGVLNAVGTALSHAATGPRQPVVELAAAEPKSAAPNRPAWVDEPAREVGDVYRMSITVGPYTTRRECDAKLPEEVNKALIEYIDTNLPHLREKLAGRLPLALEPFRRQIVKEKWEETIQASVGPMVQLHALLELDSQFKAQFNRQVEEEWRRAIIDQRLWYAGRGVAAVLVVLATTFAFLKVEIAADPVRRRRLRQAGVVVILVALAALALILS